MPASAQELGAAACSRGCPGAAFTLSPCKEWNHLQKQIATFKVLIGSLSNLALVIRTHANTRTYSHLFQGLRSLFFYNAI